MKKIIFSIVFIATIFNCKYLFAQVDSTKYTNRFNFINGVYKTYQEFKKNDPSIKESAIITEDLGKPFLYGNINLEKIKYYDSLGVIQKLKRRDVWGYCSKGDIYVMLNNNFHKIFIIGSIMHFTEAYNVAIIDNYKSVPVTDHTAPIKYNYIQHVIDFNSGNVFKYELENFLLLLKKDQILYDEFNSIKSRKKKTQNMFLYLNKFNERNPVYFKC